MLLPDELSDSIEVRSLGDDLRSPTGDVFIGIPGSKDRRLVERDPSNVVNK